MKTIFQKFNPSPRTSILIGVFTLAFFMVGMQKFKAYESEMTILVVPKSANAVGQQNQILDNLIQLPKTLAFYDRLLKDNPSFQDSAAGESALNRKNSWNEMFSIKQVSPKGSMLSVSISINSQADADLIVAKTARALLDVTSSYYNVKDDVDLRIVDGPITKVVINRWPLLILLSFLFGILLTLVVEKILNLEKKVTDPEDVSENKTFQSFNFFKKISQPMPLEALENLYEHETKIFQNIFAKKQPIESEKQVENQTKQTKNFKQVEPSAEIAHLQEIVSRGVYPNFPEMPVHGAPQSAAPANLPIADFGIENDLSDQEFKPAPEKTHEPTSDELKNRLNQLLKGDL